MKYIIHETFYKDFNKLPKHLLKKIAEVFLELKNVEQLSQITN